MSVLIFVKNHFQALPSRRWKEAVFVVVTRKQLFAHHPAKLKRLLLGFLLPTLGMLSRHRGRVPRMFERSPHGQYGTAGVIIQYRAVAFTASTQLSLYGCEGMTGDKSPNC